VLKAGHWRIEPLAAKIEGKRLVGAVDIEGKVACTLRAEASKMMALAIRRWCT
jgi:hypothetical protein